MMKVSISEAQSKLAELIDFGRKSGAVTICRSTSLGKKKPKFATLQGK